MVLKAGFYILLGASIAFAGVLTLTGSGPVTVDIDIEGEATPAGEATPEENVARDFETETQQPTEKEAGLDSTAIEWAIHNRINEIRKSRDLSRLKMSGELREAARMHSSDMANRNYFSHESPEGETFKDRYEQVGYTCRVETGTPGKWSTGAENIAKRNMYETNETEIGYAIVEQWMNSEGHRENILREYWGREGIGISVASDGTVYATQNFC